MSVYVRALRLVRYTYGLQTLDPIEVHTPHRITRIQGSATTNTF